MPNAVTFRRFLSTAAAAIALSLGAGQVSPAAAAPHGGNGGSPFTANCGANAVLVGAIVRAGTVVQSINPVCVKVKADGAWEGATFGVGQYGGSGGSYRELICPNNHLNKRIAVGAPVTGTYTVGGQ